MICPFVREDMDLIQAALQNAVCHFCRMTLSAAQQAIFGNYNREFLSGMYYTEISLSL